MTTLTEKFATLEGELSDQAAALLSATEATGTAISNLQTSVDGIASDIVLLRNKLLAAVSQTDPCMTCPPPSLITPPTDTTSNPINADKCKRVQAFLNAIHEISGVLGAVSNSGIVWTPSIVQSGISEVLTTLVTTGSVPLPSFGEAVNIAGDTINYGLSNIGRNDNLQSQFDSISSGMIQPMYQTATPDAIQAEYTSLVDASSLPNDEKLLFKALAFNALVSYFFDPSSNPDLSPYTTSPCSFPTCISFTTDEMDEVSGDSGTGWIPHWAKYGITPVSLPGQDNPVWVCVQANNATWDNTGYSDVYHQRQDDPGGGTVAETGTFASLAVSNWITCVRSAGPFAITLCGILPADSC